jgi:hypothetical protein
VRPKKEVKYCQKIGGRAKEIQIVWSRFEWDNSVLLIQGKMEKRGNFNDPKFASMPRTKEFNWDNGVEMA